MKSLYFIDESLDTVHLNGPPVCLNGPPVSFDPCEATCCHLAGNCETRDIEAGPLIYVITKALNDTTANRTELVNVQV